MPKFTHNDLFSLLLAIGIMLILARLISELGKRFRLPIVMGELLVGILLGPSVFGSLDHNLYITVFPQAGTTAKVALDGITSLAVIMLLFVAGMEVQLQIMLKQGKTAIYTSFTSMIIPFALGFCAVWFVPQWFSYEPDHKLVYALFFGTAMAISAIPVIVKILMDLNIYKTRVGQIVMAAAIFDDLTGWLLFSLILSLMGKQGEITSVWYSVGMILGFGLFMLLIGRRIIDRALPWVQTKLSWPGGVLSLALGLCFLSASFTESIGLHAILGAFIMGIAFGDSVHLNERAREIILQFVTNIFAPLFFVSLGLKVNFIQNFDITLVGLVLFLAVVCKLAGASLGAYMGGLSRREAIAVGFGLNARGAMEIILGTLALEAGLIDEKMFVALVIMALITSLISGPLMKRFTDAAP
ncbi:MAG TPA: cation:proton antiporter [Bacteroidia bacterium]|jgi:Kef-type K+ transport system membrane component KefB